MIFEYSSWLLTFFQFFANSTIRPASIIPYPNEWEYHLPTPLTFQSSAFKSRFRADCTIMCCISRQLRLGLASRTRAAIAAAMGADADVPVCLAVHIPRKSVVTIFGWVDDPEEYVVANVDEHCSEYHGISNKNTYNDLWWPQMTQIWFYLALLLLTILKSYKWKLYIRHSYSYLNIFHHFPMPRYKLILFSFFFIKQMFTAGYVSEFMLVTFLYLTNDN